jgi:RNA polymerase sigma-70 factor, ECF subfamily
MERSRLAGNPRQTAVRSTRYTHRKSLSSIPPSTITAATAAAYEDFAPYVQARLREFGVRDADLPDLCHEVFLIVHDRAEELAQIDRLDLWLRAICRRVAAGYRRRAGHRNELLGIEAEVAALRAETPDDVPASDRHQQLALVRRALNRLDDESRDLLALAEVGEIPITELARLLDHDRKTVRKRLDSARRRVTRLVAQTEDTVQPVWHTPPLRITPTASPVMRDQAARGRESGCAAELEILNVTPGRNVGVIGNAVIGTWAGVISPEMVDSVFRLAPRAVERCGGEFAYLALFEPELTPPSLAARQRIVEALEFAGPYIAGFAVVTLGTTSAIGAPILSSMMLLARPRFPIRSFTAIEPAADWLCENYARSRDGALSAAELVAAAEHVRGLRPKTS